MPTLTERKPIPLPARPKPDEVPSPSRPEQLPIAAQAPGNETGIVAMISAYVQLLVSDTAAQLAGRPASQATYTADGDVIALDALAHVERGCAGQADDAILAAAASMLGIPPTRLFERLRERAEAEAAQIARSRPAPSTSRKRSRRPRKIATAPAQAA